MRAGVRVLVAVGLVLTATNCGPAAEPSATSTPVAAPDVPTAGSGLPGPTRSSPSPSPGGATAPTTDAGRTLTAADDGVDVVLDVGEQVELVQSDPLSPDPSVTGDAVELVEVVNVTGSNQREWEVRARAPGTAEVSVPDASGTFRITVEVR